MQDYQINSTKKQAETFLLLIYLYMQINTINLIVVSETRQVKHEHLKITIV